MGEKREGQERKRGNREEEGGWGFHFDERRKRLALERRERWRGRFFKRKEPKGSQKKKKEVVQSVCLSFCDTFEVHLIVKVVHPFFNHGFAT